MSALGQKQTCAAEKVMSALPPIADMCDAKTNVRFVPTGHRDTAAKSAYPSVADVAFQTGKRRPTSFRLKAFRLEHWSSVCSFKKLDERLRRLGCVGAGPDSGSEDCHACELPWQRSHQLRTRHGHDLRSLPNADLGFAPGDDIGGLSPGTRMVFDFICSAIPSRSTTPAKYTPLAPPFAGSA